MCAECDRAVEAYGVGSAVVEHVKSWYHPKPPPPKWRYLEWSAFCEWVQGRKVREQKTNGDGDIAVLFFEDGAVAELHSNYEGDLSDETPGAGFSPPTVKVLTAESRQEQAAAAENRLRAELRLIGATEVE